MRIAQIAPLYEAVPPRFYGGTERIVAYLTDALVAMGHEVTLFASGDSRTRAKLVHCRDQALRLDPELGSDLGAHLALLDAVRARAHQFDVLHFHLDLVHFPLFEDLAEQTLTTLHGRLDMKDVGACYRRFSNFPLVSISDNQRRGMPNAYWASTVYHGLPPGLLRFTPFPRGDYLAFLGRVSAEKGPLEAIEIAKRVGMKLKIAAKIGEGDREYFKQSVEPLLDHPLVEFIGEIGEADKSEFLGNARAVLFPISWPEPFGLVMIEAMACGTPVIAYRHGSVPEIIEHGLTGLIVDDVAAAAQAVQDVRQLNRARIRRRFEQRFSVEVMARGYLSLYNGLSSSGMLPMQAVKQRQSPLVT